LGALAGDAIGIVPVLKALYKETGKLNGINANFRPLTALVKIKPGDSDVVQEILGFVGRDVGTGRLDRRGGFALMRSKRFEQIVPTERGDSR